MGKLARACADRAGRDRAALKAAACAGTVGVNAER